MIIILGIIFPVMILLHIVPHMWKHILTKWRGEKKINLLLNPKFIGAYSVSQDPDRVVEWNHTPKPSMEIMMEGLKDTFNMFLKEEEKILYFLSNLDSWRMVFWPTIRNHQHEAFFSVLFSTIIELRGNKDYISLSLEEKHIKEIETAYDCCLEYYNSVCDDKEYYE